MARSFAQQMQDVIDNRRAVSRKVFAAVNIQLAEKIITRTPVDTGRARGNWNATIDQPDDKTGSGSESSALSGARSTAAKIQPGQTFYLVNGLPYIRKLEYGGYGDGPKTVGGFSKQAPAGMIRVTAEEFRAAVREALRREQ